MLLRVTLLGPTFFKIVTKSNMSQNIVFVTNHCGKNNYRNTHTHALAYKLSSMTRRLPADLEAKLFRNYDWYVYCMSVTNSSKGML